MAQRRNNKKWLWWGTGILLVVVVVVGIVLGINNQGDGGDNKTEENGTERVEKNLQNPNNGQDDENDRTKQDEEVAKQQEVTQYEGGNPNEADELSGAVTYAAVNGDALMIRTSIDQYLTSGECKLVLSQGDAVIYTDEAAIIGDVSTAICQGFDVPLNQIGRGNIQITINLNSDGRRGVVRGEVNI